MAPGRSRSSLPRPETQLFDFDDEDEDEDEEEEEEERCSGDDLGVSEGRGEHVGRPLPSSLSRHINSRGGRRHFFTFGGGPFAGSARRLAHEVECLGEEIFQAVHAFVDLPSEIELDPRWERHVRPGGSKGCGWWFWKPALVNHLLRTGTLVDGDTLVYGDAGCIVGSRSQETWLSYFQRVEEGDVDLVAFHHEHLERCYTKGDTFLRFGQMWDDAEYGLTCQLVGGYWVVSINARSRRFFALWESLAEDTALISDDPPRRPNPHFVENRHDQSLLSMLVKGNAPAYERADGGHFNALSAAGAAAPAGTRTRPDTWWPGSVASAALAGRAAQPPRSAGSAALPLRHAEFGIPDFRVVVLRDCGWPVTYDEAQPIAAARLRRGPTAARRGLRGGGEEEEEAGDILGLCA